VPNTPEAFARVLIDQALKDSGWDLSQALLHRAFAGELKE
jgi:hypothetical protein